MIELDVQIPLAHFDLICRAELPGRVIALVGRSGSGKTSLLEAIAGLRPAARGRVVIDEQILMDTDRGIFLPPERRSVGLMPQDSLLFPHLSVRQNLQFSRKDPADLARLAALFEISHLLDRAPAALSGGERQRVALARALMSRPRLLLLDEPLAAIDQPLKEKILVHLRRIRDQLGIPMIYVTHQITEGLALSDFALALDAGRVTGSGAPDDVLHCREVAGRQSVQNVFEVDRPVHDAARGLTWAETAKGMRVVIPHEQVEHATFPLTVAIDGEEILVFSQRPGGISARNVLEGPIRSLTRFDGMVDLVIGTPTPFRVRITEDAASELELDVGRHVWLALKTWAFRIVG